MEKVIEKQRVDLYIPPIIVTVHAAFAEWGIPLQIAARRERNKHDFMPLFFVEGI